MYLHLHMKHTAIKRNMNFLKKSTLAFVFLSFLFSSEMVGKVEFFNGSFPSVRQSAAANNRPFFAYFTASWCMPCRNMDQSTWLDPNLAEYIDDNYYGIKIDVDDFDGYAYKEQYKIRAYPTILLFEPDGTFMKRVEGGVSGSAFLDILKQYDTFTDNSTISTPDEIVNTAPPTINYGSLPPTKDSQPSSIPQPQPQPKNQEEYLPGYQPKPEKIISTGSGLFRFSVEREASEGFSVQVGVYADYENVMREVSAYQLKFNEPILVHIDKLEDRTVYRILIGDFRKADRATKLKEKVLEAGIPEAFVKNLETLK